MNSDTIWLQVPSAHLSTPEKINPEPKEKLKNISYKLSTLQNTNLPRISNISILLFFSELSTALANDIFNPFSETHNNYKYIEEKFKLKIELINLTGVKPSRTIPRLFNANIIKNNKYSSKIGITDTDMAKAINIGRQSAQRIKLNGAQLFIANGLGGENNSSLTALVYALMNIPQANFSKADNNNYQLIQEIPSQNKQPLTFPLEILGRFGNSEIATLTGSYLCCAHMGLPVLIDGLFSSIAALITTLLCPGSERWFIYSRTPDNYLESIIYNYLKIEPIQETGVALKNMAGIISTISLLKLACTQHNNNEIY